MGAVRRCHATGCRNTLTGRQRKWCSDRCKTRQHQRDSRAAERHAADDPVNTRRGGVYDEIVRQDLYDQYVAGTLTANGIRAKIEAAWGTDVQLDSVKTALAALRVDRARQDRAAGWQMHPKVKAMLALGREIPDVDDDPDGFESWLDWAVDGFCQFRHRFFRTKDGHFITKRFHRKWIRATIRAIVTGGKQMILSPPRHGKTELLIHFCVWLICRDHEIRIMWVGSNSDIAEEALGSVKEQLEDNHQLIAAVLPPDQRFRPARRTGWSATRFTVDCRKTVGQKSPTMVALGIGGKILSRDVDFIVSDDIQDHDNTRQPKQREDARTWFFQTLDTRKEEFTAWLAIGSRQHWDDLWGYLIDDPTWEHIVEQAHDDACTIPENKPAQHVECMLFPELRSYRWLLGKKVSALVMGKPELYEMVYQNQAQVEGSVFWTRDVIRLAWNIHRDLGIPELPNGRIPYLIGGLDPSAVNFQAGFCWAIDLEADVTKGERLRYMVDLDNQRGGGIDRFMELGDEWRERYGLLHWVVEIAMWRGAAIQEQRLLEWQQRYGMIVEPHETQQNKMDRNFGIGGERSMYGGLDGTSPVLVDLPYGTSEAQAKVELFTTQMLRFTEDAQVLKRRTTDVLMASWIPARVIRRLVNEALAARERQDVSTLGGYDGFSGFASDYDFSTWNS